MKKVFIFQFSLALILIVSPVRAEIKSTSAIIDTTYINEITAVPVIDGIGDDECWKNSNWYGINNVWINYGKKIDSLDYYGRYKVVWSKKENLLYFLVEIRDDYPVGGYISGKTAAIYNYDIIEVFLDENRSKGPNNVTNQLTGKNIENAFAYHIYADFPKDGEVNKIPVVEDVPGPRDDNFPEFAIKGANNFYTREFSVKVYDSTYTDINPESSRVQLQEGKTMGLSLAYCDNDENDGLRDNFFGSVWVPEANYNNHWLNADDYEPAKLVSLKTPLGISENFYNSALELYPNPVSDLMTIKAYNSIKQIAIFDITGKQIKKLDCNSNSVVISTNSMPKGEYIIKAKDYTNLVTTEKFMK